MARLTLQPDDLVVSSFATHEISFAIDAKTICTGDISTCPRTSPEGGCVCTADISTCPRTDFDTKCAVGTVATVDLN